MPTICEAGGSFATRARCSDGSRRAANPDDREQALKELLIAEGSDWFWWYGDDHSSDHDLEFDELFRRHLRNVYQMLGQPVPEELFCHQHQHEPRPGVGRPRRSGSLKPVLDGRATSYFEWLPAGESSRPMRPPAP